MSAWHRGLARVVRGFLYGPVELGGPAPASSGARIIVVSHRNGAVDGYLALRAFPRAQPLVSQQLLRHPILRIFADGIPVIRAKDAQRYGWDPALVPDPVRASCDHLRAGGELMIFPEGTSDWGFRPQRYQRGAARMAAILLAEGSPVQIVPLGLHYSEPDRLLALAGVHRGPALDLRPGGVVDEAELHARIKDALDAVSVVCSDQPSFDRRRRQAATAARSGARFAEAFLARPAADAPIADPPGWPRVLGLALMVAMAPVLLAGWIAGRFADGPNTVTFHRMLGGTLMALLWLPALAVIAVWWPMPVMMGLASAVLGRALLGVRRWRP